jgi:hypothetical protein
VQTLILGSAKEALSVASWPEPSVAGAPTERTVGRRAIPLSCSSATFLSPLCYTFAPSLTLQQIVASALAWEKRKRGGRYYTRSRRSPEDGRVLREYVGSGPLAKIVAEEDRTKRELGQAECKRQETELKRGEHAGERPLRLAPNRTAPDVLGLRVPVKAHLDHLKSVSPEWL